MNAIKKIRNFVNENYEAASAWVLSNPFMYEQRGQATVKLIIVVAATLFIGIKVITEIAGSITGLTGTANTTYSDVEGYMWTGILFVGLGLLVIGAMYILNQIGGLGGRQQA